MKHCPRCGISKQVADFYRKPERHDGLSGWCITCENAAGKASLRKLYLQVVGHLGGRCVRCGYDTPGAALQIDHVNGGGFAEVRAAPGHRKLLRRALTDTEGAYQLLCANCNQIKRMENKEFRDVSTYTRDVADGTVLKRCARCRETKTSAEYYRNSARADGLSVYCAPCVTEVERKRKEELRAKAISSLGGACARCGYDRDRRALQIDHVNGGGVTARKSGDREAAMFRAIIRDPASGRYQCLCANCNILKRVANKEHRPRSTYEHNPAVTRRPTRRYLTEPEIREAIRLVQEEGLTQREAAARFGITQPTLSQHIIRRAQSVPPL